MFPLCFGFPERLRLKSSISLYRDQRRLAETKMRALSHNDPLRAKYVAWIADLLGREATAADSASARSAGNTAPMRNAAAAPESVVRVEVPATETSGTSNHDMTSLTVAEACRKARRENQLLRQMLARYDRS